MTYHIHHYLHTAHISSAQFQEMMHARILRAFAYSITSVFIPYFIVQSYGGDINAAIGYVALYYGAYYGFRVFLSPLAGRWISRYGAKHTIIIATVFSVFGTVALLGLSVDPIFVWVSAILGGLGNTFYFPSIHSFLSVAANKKHSSSQIGSLMIFRKISMALAPLLGGLIAAMYGFSTMPCY